MMDAIDALIVARAIHVLALVHWIGGVAMVTLVILPALLRIAEPAQRLELFEALEGRFAWQARISVALVGLSGFYMVYEREAWVLFLYANFWWLHAMVALWAVFVFILFIAEPLFLHTWFHTRAQTDPDGTFALVLRFHRLVLTLSMATLGAGVLGAHGLF